MNSYKTEIINKTKLLLLLIKYYQFAIKIYYI